tara:strand:- start:58 stop:774 length:717 start_codon:yes stop_codon:yes gene_type:complete
MGNNVEGFEYENTVIAALVESGYCGEIKTGAGASAADADADMFLGNARYLIEVKKDMGAQMGGTSVRYVDGQFTVASDAVDTDTQQMIVEALSPKVEAIEHFLCEIGATQFPTSCTKHQWDNAKVRGLLKPINAKIRKDASFIIDHYQKKGINYIQIGGAGLFYLGENPADLPIPQLEGEIDIELRAGRSGSKVNANGIAMVGGGLRAQGRLKFKGESPYSLDDPRSIKQMVEDWIKW